jgi:hypothetical protein
LTLLRRRAHRQQWIREFAEHALSVIGYRCRLVIDFLKDCIEETYAWFKEHSANARLLPMRAGVLRVLGNAFGYQAHVDRLFASLVVDTANTRSDLTWFPPVSVCEGLERTAHWYLSEGAASDC